MVIPTFERSLDMIIDNDFELTKEETEQLYKLLNADEQVITNIISLIGTMDPNTMDKEQFKSALKNVMQKNSSSVEQLYEKITMDKKIIAYIQEILLKRLID